MKTPAIADEIKSYLNEIAERLWTGHATVMIGAGFSRNAKTKSTSQKPFPDWNQLGDVFYEKIHGEGPGRDNRYLNALKLADEVQAAFGRPALDQILRSKIPDDEYEPSHLHTQLLELPWTDVFTTNYDTLLERAKEKVNSQRFDIVINKEDLVYSEKPRIIKLHGSFPSERPFIITEEDYRKYPKDFAPFVNTVQQSLLENTLCLIGFSGDDPNFLQWIGWIRDNLGKGNSPKIFLIGIFDLSDAQKKLLEQRNIVLVDMSVCPDINGEHAKALEVFFDYLFSKKKDDNKLEWPFKQQFMHPDSQKNIVQQLKDIINEWKNKRKSYPNWAILPEGRRKSLWIYTEVWTNIQSYCDKLETPQDIEFLYELNWRLEKCLCPIFNNNINAYKSIVEKYNPYPTILTIENASIARNDKSYKKINWKEIKVKWLELHISMMRYYREEGYLEEWEIINNRIQQLYPALSHELIASLHYERCLFALFTLKISDVREQIRSWPSNPSLPFWEAKRAGLIAELGDIDEAEKILEKSLSSIRTQLNLTPVSADYSWVSKEAFVMLLLQYIKNATILRHGQFSKIEEIRERFSNRWNSLKRYKCDPWLELKLFENCLEREPIYIAATSEKYEFDIGRVTSTHHLGHTDTEALAAYSFLRYFEEAGIPFRIPGTQIGTKLAVGALKRVANYSPYWSFATFLRTGDSKAADIIFGRESIYKMSVKQIDRFIEEYLQILQNSQAEIEKGDCFHRNNFGVVLATVIPEALSRLCVKCSTNVKDKLLDFLKETYSSGHRHKYKGMLNLTRRLLGSYSAAEQYSNLPILLEFPVLKNLNPIIRNEYPDPFYFVDINQEYLSTCKDIQIEQTAISQLLQKVGSEDSDERKRAIRRIAELYKLNLLNENQIKEFSEALWSQTDESTGFPKNIDFYKFAFLKSLPHPNNIDPVSLFKGYIAKEKFPIQKTKAEKGISMTNGDIPFCDELIGATKSPFFDKGIDWSERETIDIFHRLLEWWDLDKEFTKKDNDTILFGNTGDEFKKRFANLAHILERVVIPRLSPQTSIKKDMSRLLKELSEYGVSCVATYAASLCLFPEQRQVVFDKIETAMLSKQKEKIRNGYGAIHQIFILYNTNKIEDISPVIWAYIASPIKWRSLPNLVYALNTEIDILNNFSEALTGKWLNDIVFGLGCLIEETSLQNQQSGIDIAERLDIRAVAASLACTLYKYYLKKDLSIPETLQKWKSICNDVAEFSDIRNKWKSR